MNPPDLSSVPFIAKLGVWALPMIAVVFVWVLVLKGIALWKSARHGHKGWFIALLIVNSIGILELIYIFWISKKVERREAGAASTETAE